ncbi:MAG: aminopeptidase P family protein [Candidatus Omnitrophica bacterium]|nr:aminopeptidase P family protein [Candidatus Omnitrophota bacterium]
MSRLQNTLLQLKTKGLDSLIVSSDSDITYLTNYPSRDSLLLLSEKLRIFLTDGRYFDEAKSRIDKKIRIEKNNGPLLEAAANICNKSGLKRIGFDEHAFNFAQYNKLHSLLVKNAKLLPAHGLIADLRQLKDEYEIKKIRKAIQITKETLRFIQKFIKPGIKEIEIAGEIERFIRYKGANSPAFDIIVASGTNSCYPHHISSQRKLRPDEPVLIDLGVDYEGYKSDLTRVFFLGKINTLVRDVYKLILKAQEHAFGLIKPGINSKQIDSAARLIIKEAGYGDKFSHSLGHGVGLDIHENPRISPKSNTIMQPGMVFTIEPAVYLPNKFGIRIEDMVLVTEKGGEVLSGAIN